MTEYEASNPNVRQDKFARMLPRQKKLFYLLKDSPDHVIGIVYISEHKLELVCVKENNVWCIEIFVDKKEQVVTIPWVSVSKRYQGNGIGKYLLILAADLARSYGVLTMELDDHSDNAWSQDNMYLQLGLQYIGSPPQHPNSGDPEMRGNVVEISRNWKRYRQKYIRRPFFR